MESVVWKEREREGGWMGGSDARGTRRTEREKDEHELGRRGSDWRSMVGGRRGPKPGSDLSVVCSHPQAHVEMGHGGHGPWTGLDQKSSLSLSRAVSAKHSLSSSSRDRQTQSKGRSSCSSTPPSIPWPPPLGASSIGASSLTCSLLTESSQPAEGLQRCRCPCRASYGQ